MLDKLIVILIGLQVLLRASFLDISIIPQLDIGGSNSVGIQDLLFFALLITVFLKLFSGRENSLGRTTPTVLLTVFLVLGLLGVVNAVFTGTGFHLAAREARDFFLYIIYFMVLSLPPSGNNVKKLANILVALAVLAALFTILQLFLGDKIAFLYGKVQTLKTLDATVEGVERIGAGGLATINLAFFIYLSVLIQKIDKKHLILFSILAIAILVSFNRGTWVSIILALMFLYPFVDKKQRAGYIKILVVLGVSGVLIFGAGFLGVLGQKMELYTTAGLDRFASLLPGQVEEDGSVQGRVKETEIVFRKAMERPLFGHGLGAITQDSIVGGGGDGNTTRGLGSWGYVHNGYLYILFKLGFTGLFIFLLFIIIFIVRAVRFLGSIHDALLKPVYLGSLLFIVSIVPHSVASPRIMEGKYIIIIALALGLIELIRNLSTQDLNRDKNSSISQEIHSVPDRAAGNILRPRKNLKRKLL